MKKILNSVYVRFMLAVLPFLAAASFIVISVLLGRAGEIMEAEIYAYMMMEQTAQINSVESVLSNINLTCVKLLVNSELFRLLSDGDEGGISGVLTHTLSDNTFISNAAIVTQSGETYLLYDNLDIRPGAHELPPSGTGTPVGFVEGSGKLVDGGIGSGYHIMLVRELKNISTGSSSGYLVIYIRSALLMSAELSGGDRFGLLINEEGRVISSSSPGMIGHSFLDLDTAYSPGTEISRTSLDGTELYYSTAALSDSLARIGLGWRVVNFIEEESLSAGTKRVNSQLMLFIAVCSGVIILMSVFMLSYITKPVRRLQMTMNAATPGKIPPGRAASPYTEIFQLESAYHDMVARTEELMKKNIEEKEKQRELELSVLQAQINPHFLYNTLDTIVWLAKIKKEPDIEQLTMALAQFYRMSLHKGDRYITVAEELAVVKSFITIEQIRFPRALATDFQIEPELLKMKILKLTLQPVVENALVHGLRDIKTEGVIGISGILYEDYIVFEVRDNGKGFDVAALEQETQTDKQGGYGLKNVDERIRLEYGGRSGINIISRVGEGTRVIVKLMKKFLS